MTFLIAAVGWVGAVNVLIAYVLLLRHRTSADGHVYLTLNFLGSGCLAVSTSVAHAWSSAAVNLIWLAIGVAPLVRAWGSFQPVSAERLAGARLAGRQPRAELQVRRRGNPRERRRLASAPGSRSARSAAVRGSQPR
jgi:hypothetical protein